MAKKPGVTTESALQFFGQISASISHELKNVLAIVNENAGLLEDFTLMADRGLPIDPARLKVMAAAVKKQIGRADGILKNMNRFAHSTDQTFTTVDLAQTIELMIALTARFAAMRGIQVDRQLPQNPVRFRTAPYFLINLLWLCLDFSMSASGDQKRVALVTAETENDIRIKFRQLAGLTKEMLQDFPSEPERNLLKVLAAELTTDLAGHAIVLRLAKNLA